MNVGVLPASYVFSVQHGRVAQICNLPYRRFIIGRASESSSALELADLPQNAILRYSAARRSLAVPQPKERGVYAASAHEVPQLVK